VVLATKAGGGGAAAASGRGDSAVVVGDVAGAREAGEAEAEATLGWREQWRLVLSDAKLRTAIGLHSAYWWAFSGTQVPGSLVTIGNAFGCGVHFRLYVELQKFIIKHSKQHRFCLAVALNPPLVSIIFSSHSHLGGGAAWAQLTVLPMMLVAEEGGLGLGVGEVGTVFACMSAVNVLVRWAHNLLCLHRSRGREGSWQLAAELRGVNAIGRSNVPSCTQLLVLLLLCGYCVTSLCDV
jgi:hypothetical protein